MPSFLSLAKTSLGRLAGDRGGFLVLILCNQCTGKEDMPKTFIKNILEDIETKKGVKKIIDVEIKREQAEASKKGHQQWF